MIIHSRGEMSAQKIMWNPHSSFHKIYFLQLWFYVKSILADFLKVKDCPFNSFDHFELDFLKNSHFKTKKIATNSKVRAAKMVKTADFDHLKLAIVDFT